MSAPIVLPKFHLPGQRPHWAIRTLWIAGGLVLVQGAALAVALLTRPPGPTQESAAVAATPANPLAAPLQRAAGAPPSIVVSTGAAAASEPAASPALPAPAEQAAAAAPAPTPKTKAARTSARRSGYRGKMLAKASSSAGRSNRTPAKSKPDAIDELLRKFK